MSFSKIFPRLLTKCFQFQHQPSFNFVRNFTVSHSKNSFMTINDCNIYYKKIGHGPQTLFCLPGILGFTDADFVPVMRVFDPKIYTVISWDPPGYGKSRPPDRQWCTEFYSRDAIFAAKVMQNLNIESYSVLGWSNGGITGIHLAANNPDAVEKLVIWGAHAFADKKALQFAQMMVNIELWSEKMLKPMVDMYGMDYFQKLLRDWAKAVEDYYMDTNYTENYFRDQKKVSCPTLILHGGLDIIIDVDHANALHKHIPDSLLHIIPNGKHNLHLRDMDLFLQLVTDFLSDPQRLKEKLPLTA